MLHEVHFPSTNNRDTVTGWIYAPACDPVGVVQLVHGFGEHSRRYLHMIVALMDAGFIVAADDHVGHGATAIANDTWGDWGDAGPHTMMEDEKRFKDLVCEKYPDLPHFMFGHRRRPRPRVRSRVRRRAHGLDVRALLRGSRARQRVDLP